MGFFKVQGQVFKGAESMIDARTSLGQVKKGGGFPSALSYHSIRDTVNRGKKGRSRCLRG
jgi:hypothetical protein